MKMLIPFLTFCLVATCNAELRTWTAVNGKEVEAEFVSNEKGLVKLKLESGKVFEVPLNKLSKADQEFLIANPFSGSLEDNIVGKLMTLESEGDVTELQFNEDGRIMVRMNDFGLTYKIDNNDVLFFKGEELDGGISFSSSIPKVGDQVEWGPKKEKMRAKITMIQEAINFESQLVGKWVAKVAGAKALFTFPAIETQTEWSWYNKKTPANGLEYRWEVKFVDPEFGYSFGPSLFKFSDSEGPVKGSLSELIGVCQHDLWKLFEDSGENIGSYGQTKVTENKVHLIVTNKILIDYLLESKPVHVEMMINTPRFGFNEKVAVDYELPNASKEKHQQIKEEVKSKELVAEAKPVEELPLNPNLKYEIKDGTVTITGCDSKASGELTIPATIEGYPVTSIGGGAFIKCTNLTRITIPDNVTSIGKSAFYLCTNLKSITIPEGVTSIESSTFGNSGLTNITIPESVTSIGNAAFQNCESLTKVIFLGDAPRTEFSLLNSFPIIYRKPDAKGWGDKWLDRPVKLINEKP